MIEDGCLCSVLMPFYMALILIQRIMLLLRESCQKMHLEFAILKKENRLTVEQTSNKHFVTTPVEGKAGNIAIW